MNNTVIQCLMYMRSDGSNWIFGVRGDGRLVVASPATASAILSGSASTGWTISFSNGEQRQFNTTGQLTAVVDRNGNRTQVAYDSNNRLSTVTDPASRHLYFNYPVNTPPSFIANSVTSDFGLTLSYSYNGQGVLSQVTKPDLTTITYTYNALSQITQVTDSNGKILESHTYDSAGHGLTSSRANGVDLVTVTAPQ
jgi:YD repeat-containing protein